MKCWIIGAQVDAKLDVLLGMRGKEKGNHREHRGARIDALATLCTSVPSVVQLSCFDVRKL